MSRVKVNSITPFTGQNITLGGHAVPSGSDKNLGSATNPWAELYVSTGSVNFVGVVTLGQPSQILATLRAGGEFNTGGVPTGQIFTETNNNLRGSFSVGRNNIASGTASLANGYFNTASGFYSHAEGGATQAVNYYSHAEGSSTKALGIASHAEGQLTHAANDYSHAEGYRTSASGVWTHAEGSDTQALGNASHTEGQYTLASGSYSHAEGFGATASGNYSHAEGNTTRAIGDSSHAEGYQTTASGNNSHAEGSQTVALGNSSHAGGYGTIASGSYQTVFGQFNTQNNTSSVFIVGAGAGFTSSSRKDGFSVEVDSFVRPHIVLPTNTSNPSNPKTGSMYFNPTANLMYIWNGTAWKTASFA